MCPIIILSKTDLLHGTWQCGFAWRAGKRVDPSGAPVAPALAAVLDAQWVRQFRELSRVSHADLREGGALLLDPQSRTDTYPTIEIDESDVTIGHEATVSKVGEEQLFYLMSRGLTQEQATTMVVSGFIEPLVKELPMEYAVEMNRLIQLQMEGSVG